MTCKYCKAGLGEYHKPSCPDTPKYTQIELNAAVKAERERSVDILERLHERAAGQHNYYLYAANIIREQK